MKGKPAIVYQKYVINDFFTCWTVLRLDEDDLWFVMRMIFDSCNKIASDSLLNVFEFDSMAYKKILSKKKVITPC